MNANNRSGVETPRDGVGGMPTAGPGGPHPAAWEGAPPAGPEDSGPSSSSSGPAGLPDARMVAALEAYMDALRAGRPLSREEFLSGHAEIAEELGDCLSGLEFIQKAVVELGGSPGAAASAPAEAIAPCAQLGDYRILREVGRGGMGVVYEAEQVSLGRRVALKVLPFAAAIDPKQRQRFQIEAQAAAQLHHPHIVPIFGVGCDQGVHYYAMQFVDGRSLAAILHELRSDPEAPGDAGFLSAPASPVATEEATGSWPEQAGDGSGPGESDRTGAIERGRKGGSGDPPASGSGLPAGRSRPAKAAGPVHHDRNYCRNIARIGAEAADALDHAHGLGILHRDIKPANLLIDPHGAVWITDFGLARFPGDLSLTGTGDVVGTVRYMSPEQAQARRGVVDQRTDIYSLGVTLYEILTLRPAFDGRDHQELLRQIAVDEPVSPRRLNPAIPRDLETIVMKGMAKDPSQRYGTAQELSADLGRFLADEPILARRPGPLERVVRWSRRHWELVTTAAAVLVVSLIIGSTLIWAQSRETRLQAAKTDAAAKQAEEASNAYHAYMIESYPLIDTFAEGAITQALGMAQGRSGPARREEAFKVFDQWLRILQQTSELPRTDRESRIIIARACTRLGYARAYLSMARGTADGQMEPTLLAQATEDYRRSIALFDELLAASPDDAKLQRYLADAVGVFGMGCCFRFAYRNGEAETCYRRAIQLRRDLVRGKGRGRAVAGEHVDAAGEVSNFSRLVSTVQILAGMRRNEGRAEEAEGLIGDLERDSAALAARFPGPEFQELRRKLADALMMGPSPASRAGRQYMVRYCRLALIVDPEHPLANNNLAWVLASVPEDPWFNPKEALKLARKAVELNPTNGDYWNTLGVAALRARDWASAAEALQRSNRISGGTGIDCFCLAMTRWEQGKRKEAREFFDSAIAWLERTRSEDPEVRRFHVEAAVLLGLPGPRRQPDEGGAPKADSETEATRQAETKSGGAESTRGNDRDRDAPGSQGPEKRGRDRGALMTHARDGSIAEEVQTACPCPDARGE